ncbi:MAG: hypothetical protein [Bacteriophage sp.]|jgi:hypothetical protein|nr:MAG: hypothetical protein [Bacteriophage sp.]
MQNTENQRKQIQIVGLFNPLKSPTDKPVPTAPFRGFLLGIIENKKVPKY